MINEPDGITVFVWAELLVIDERKTISSMIILERVYLIRSGLKSISVFIVTLYCVQIISLHHLKAI